MIARETFSAIRSHAKGLLQSGQHPRVLIVDDEPPIAAFIDRVLSDAGYHTTLASSGAEALKAAKGAEFDLVFTDLRMPEMDGVELVRLLRERQTPFKVLYFTGFSDLLFKDSIILADGEAFLDKPSGILGILQAVGLLLFGHLEPGPPSRAGAWDAH